MTRRLSIASGALVALCALAYLAQRGSVASTPAPMAATPSVTSAAGPPVSAVPPRAADTEVWKVTVEPDDPVKGPADALVTIVAFSDFQAPPAKRAAKTLDELLKEYPRDLRVVWKDDPLPFNPRAKPAALLARQAYDLKGNAAFWSVHDALFAGSQKLESQELQAIADKFGIPWGGSAHEAASRLPRAKIGRSIELARDVQARGTPHFFINGVRLPGAQPTAKFRQRIEQALAKASQLVSQGIARQDVYTHIISQGHVLPIPEKRPVSLPAAEHPQRGPATAPVVLQYWAELPCATCALTMHRLLDLEQEYAADLRIVWRHTAEPARPPGLRAAQALQQAFSQAGSQTFWTFHNRLLEQQGASGALELPALEQLASELSLDLLRFKTEVGSSQVAARIASDVADAKAASLASPSFTINGYYLAGNPDPADLRRLVQHALREASGSGP